MSKKKPTKADLEYLAWKTAKEWDSGKIKLSADREENRRRYPELAKLVDEIRRLWPDAKMKFRTRSQATHGQDEQDD